MFKKFFSITAVVFIALVLSACGPKRATIDMVLKDFSFTPDKVSVPAGAEVTVNLKNEGTLEHEMVIMLLGKAVTPPFDDNDEPNIYWEHELEMGESESVVFTAPSEPGDYQLVCGTAGHLEAGMIGTLTVK